MYKKVSKIIITCVSFSALIECMYQEDAFKQAIQKGSIPLLAINNYVIPISNAYRALQREAELPYESLEKIHYKSLETIKNKNDRIKVLQEKKYNRVYQIPFINNRQYVLDGHSGCLLTRGIKIKYSKDKDLITAYVTAVRYVYRVEDSQFGSRKYSIKNYRVRQVPQSIIQKLPQELSTCYLLYSGDEYIDDRIVIKNMCNAVSSSVAEKALVLCQPPRIRPPRLVDKTLSEIFPPSKELSLVEYLSFTHDIHILNDDIEDYDICVPLCRRMISFMGFLLFIYLFS